MKENRLFRMLYLLLEKGQCSANYLAKTLEVSSRTIYRDMDSLSSAGIPIYATTGRNGGIQVSESYILRQSYLTENEKQDILQALHTVMTLENKKDSVALKKLSSLFHVPVSDWLQINFSKWDGDEELDTSFDLLKQSIWNHTLVTFTYVGSNGTTSHRQVKPLKLIFKSTTWYCQAYCLSQQQLRLFKLSRMIHLQSTNHNFEPFSSPEMPLKLDQEKIDCQFIVSANIAYRVYDEFNFQSIQRQENGSLLVNAKMPNESWLPLYFLSFGHYIQILEPLSLRDAIHEEAVHIIKQQTQLK